jgi:hypothetical protein
MPADLSGHVLILVWSLYKQIDVAGDPQVLLTKITRPLASCVMLDTMREDKQGNVG